jgi:hypothetical protein
MKTVDESKYSLSQDLKYASVSINIITIFALFFWVRGVFFGSFSNSELNSDTIGWIFFLIALLGLINHFFMSKLNRYPIIFSFSLVAILFIVLQVIGFGNRGHLLFLTIASFFMIYYLYLILTTQLEKPLDDKTNFNVEDLKFSGSLSGEMTGKGDLQVAQTVIFSKTFLYVVFLFSLFRTVFDMLTI